MNPQPDFYPRSDAAISRPSDERSGDADSSPAAEVVGIRKAFPGVVALDDVSFDVHRGEVHALLGENGAGKSTLIKVLAGLLQPDEGAISLDGRVVTLRSPRDARRHGISHIPQDVQAVPGLSIGRNMMLGMERFRARRARLDRREEHLVREALERSGAGFSPDVAAETLSVPELRLAQIARTLIAPGDVIMLDEPTAVLSESDADHLLERLLAFRDAGKAILYVSHRLSEVLRIATRVTVLRDGRAVGTFAREEVDRERIVRLMAERDRSSERAAAGRRTAVDATTPPLLEVEGLTRQPTFVDVGLKVRKGQIVGVAGVQGSGHGHLLRAIAGADAYDGGRVSVGGKELTPGSVRDAYGSGVILVPADRRGSAIVPAENIRSNLMLPANSGSQRLGFRQLRQERSAAKGYVDAFGIRPPATEALAGGLSGGNQQKVALARALEASPEVLLLEEPTQGIDVNAKSEIRQLIEGLVSTRGLAVVIATSEFEELLGLADVIYVMRLGRVVATIPGPEADYGTILEHALP
jgi:ribose transport system ATP-binding protein/rhamnose transport system ATP-binding protein